MTRSIPLALSAANERRRRATRSRLAASVESSSTIAAEPPSGQTVARHAEGLSSTPAGKSTSPAEATDPDGPEPVPLGGGANNENAIQVRVCLDSNDLANQYCPEVETRDYLSGDQPKTRCTLHAAPPDAPSANSFHVQAVSAPKKDIRRKAVASHEVARIVDSH